MNIGDKVRFLNTTGGGKIAGFQGKDLVLVCDDNGFEIPTLRSEIVVVETDNYNLVRKPVPSKERASTSESDGLSHTSIKAALAAHAAAANGGENGAPEEELLEDESEPADKEITFQPRPLERRGADQVNFYIGFLPVDSRALSQTEFEVYLINDSNLYVRFLLLTQEGEQYSLRHEGLVLPNQKLLLDTIGHADLPQWERLTFQLLAYKTDKPFALKSPMNITLRVDGTKFYKLHSFAASDFFNDPALVRSLVSEDRPAQSVSIAAETVEEALITPEVVRQSAERLKQQPARAMDKSVTLDRNAIVEVDLHAEVLLDSTRGLTPTDILMMQIKAFHDTMRQYAKDKGRRIVFIHGKGEGVLRATLLKELKNHYRHCTHQDASFREYGFGATMVTVR
jgi:putative DNA mismatch repair protein